MDKTIEDSYKIMKIFSELEINTTNIILDTKKNLINKQKSFENNYKNLELENLNNDYTNFKLLILCKIQNYIDNMYKCNDNNYELSLEYLLDLNIKKYFLNTFENNIINLKSYENAILYFQFEFTKIQDSLNTKKENSESELLNKIEYDDNNYYIGFTKKIIKIINKKNKHPNSIKLDYEYIEKINNYESNISTNLLIKEGFGLLKTTNYYFIGKFENDTIKEGIMLHTVNKELLVGCFEYNINLQNNLLQNILFKGSIISYNNNLVNYFYGERQDIISNNNKNSGIYIQININKSYIINFIKETNFKKEDNNVISYNSNDNILELSFYKKSINNSADVKINNIGTIYYKSNSLFVYVLSEYEKEKSRAYYILEKVENKNIKENQIYIGYISNQIYNKETLEDCNKINITFTAENEGFNLVENYVENIENNNLKEEYENNGNNLKKNKILEIAEFKDSKKLGKTLQFIDNKLVFEGIYNNDVPLKGSFYDNGFKFFEGEFVNNSQDEYIEKESNNELYYNIYNMNKTGYLYLINGDIFEGKLNKDFYPISGDLYRDDGSIFKNLLYKNNVIDGDIIYIDQNENKHSLSFKEGKLIR